MITKQAYKETPIGKIPEDWEVVKLGDKKICEIIMGQSPPSSTYTEIKEGLPFLQGKAEFGDIYPSPRIYCSKPIKIAETNDILLSVRAPVGDVNIAPFRCCIGRGLAALRAKGDKLHYLFLFYYLKFNERRFESVSTGSTFKAIRKENIENFLIPLPPLPEQRKIAEILSTVDNAIQKVDEAIEKTERLKKGLMQELLTKGIGHKEFKDTEIGRIPEEWGVVRLGEVSKISYGLSQPPPLASDGIPMIRATNIKEGKILNNGIIKVDKTKIPSSKDVTLKEGDIIVVRSGAYTGDIGLITKEWSGSVAGYDLIVRLLAENICSLYLKFYLLSPKVQAYFKALRTRSAQPHLNSGQLKKILIAHPPIEEQQKIAEILSTVDKKLELERKRKEKLDRIKKGLMNDLLSGRRRVKVEVRKCLK